MSPLSPQTPFNISLASQSDYTSLAAILPVANAANPVVSFMFGRDHSNPSAPDPSQQWAMTQFQAAESSDGPTTHILKAVTEVGGHEEAVGLAIIRIVGGIGTDGGGMGGRDVRDEAEKKCDNDANPAMTGETSGLEADADDALNPDFSQTYLARLMDIHKRHMDGKDHACTSPLEFLSSVRPVTAACSPPYTYTLR